MFRSWFKFSRLILTCIIPSLPNKFFFDNAHLFYCCAFSSCILASEIYYHESAPKSYFRNHISTTLHECIYSSKSHRRASLKCSACFSIFATILFIYLLCFPLSFRKRYFHSLFVTRPLKLDVLYIRFKRPTNAAS